MGKFSFVGAFILSLLLGYGWFIGVVSWVFNNLTASTLYGLGAVVGWAIVFVASLYLSVLVVIGLILLCAIGGAV